MELSPLEQISFSTTRIECNLSNGDTSVGTGFFFAFLLSDGKHFPLLITNKHVIEDSVKGAFYLTESDGRKPQYGKLQKIDLPSQDKWFSHPNKEIDLCAIPIGSVINAAKRFGIQLFFRFFESEQIPTIHELENSIDRLEEILMIGYPNGLWDEKNNQPIIRKGITATHPNLDYKDNKEFLIDMACFPGSSGSPVILFNQGTYVTKVGVASLGVRMKLLGILFAGPMFTSEGEVNVKKVPTKLTVSTDIPMHLGIVIKSSELMKFEFITKI